MLLGIFISFVLGGFFFKNQAILFELFAKKKVFLIIFTFYKVIEQVKISIFLNTL